MNVRIFSTAKTAFLGILSLIFTADSLFAASKPLIGFAFDWDDNIFEMPTEVVLFHKNDPMKTKVLSTDEFAKRRLEMKNPQSEYFQYREDSSRETGTFKYFGDTSELGANAFSRDIERGMKSGNWQGPVWKDFVKALASPETAAETSLITARGHAPETIHRALGTLQKMKLINNLPQVANIWTVSFGGFDQIFLKAFKVAPPAGGASDPSARKAAVMSQILDRIQKAGIKAETMATLCSSGKGLCQQNLWGFSDDDFGNFQKAFEVLQAGVDRDRWPKVKISLFFTGKNHESEKPRAIVLRPLQKPRKFVEVQEWHDILAKGGNLEAAAVERAKL